MRTERPRANPADACDRTSCTQAHRRASSRPGRSPRRSVRGVTSCSRPGVENSRWAVDGATPRLCCSRRDSKHRPGREQHQQPSRCVRGGDTAAWAGAAILRPGLRIPCIRTHRHTPSGGSIRCCGPDPAVTRPARSPVAAFGGHVRLERRVEVEAISCAAARDGRGGYSLDRLTRWHRRDSVASAGFGSSHMHV